MWWRYFACFGHEDPFEADTKRALEESLIEEEDRIRRRKREEDKQIEINRVKQESLKLAEREEERRNRNRELEEKYKRKILEESLKKNEQLKHSKDDVEKEDEVNGAPHSICNGCKSAIEDGISLDAFGALWHPQCFCCLHCHKPIAEREILKKNQQKKHSKDDVEKEEVNGAPSSICNGCKSAIEDGISLESFGALWHFQCFCCLHCHKPIAEREILNPSKGEFHRPCNTGHPRPNCYVCEKKRYKTIDPAAASVASSSRCPPPAATTSKKGDQSSFEKKLVEFYNYQIETDDSPIYGRGFKMVNQMIVSNHYTLNDILREIQRRG